MNFLPFTAFAIIIVAGIQGGKFLRFLHPRLINNPILASNFVNGLFDKNLARILDFTGLKLKAFQVLDFTPKQSVSLYLYFLNLIQKRSEWSIDLVTVFDAILTSRQTREKLLCLYENLTSNNFRRRAVLKKI